MTVKTTGIIVNKVDFGEANCALTIITDSLGKVSVFANGVRRQKSKVKGKVELFSYDLFSFEYTNHTYRLQEIDTIEDFKNLKLSLKLLSYATYFADILSCVSQENISDAEQLQFFICVLRMLNNNLSRPDKIKLVYELRALTMAGFQPNCNECIVCGNKNNLQYFSFSGGGTLCERCADLSSDKIKLHQLILKAIVHITSCQIKRVFFFDASDKFIEQLNKIAENYVTKHLGKQFQSLNYLKKFVNFEKEIKYREI